MNIPRIIAIVLEDEGADLRARAIGDNGTLIDDRSGPTADFGALISGWRLSAGAPTINATSDTSAWRDIPCRPLPETAATPDRDGTVILPGLRQKTPPESVSPVMALQLGGLLAADPDFDGVVCIPGAQGLWAHLSAGEVVGVLRVTTCAVFAALHGPEVPTPDREFDMALSDCLSRPERLTRLLGSPHHSLSTQAAALIGAELAAARPWWLGQQIRILGNDGWPALYAHALRTQGVAAIIGDGDAALVAGVTALLQSRR